MQALRNVCSTRDIEQVVIYPFFIVLSALDSILFDASIGLDQASFISEMLSIFHRFI